MTAPMEMFNSISAAQDRLQAALLSVPNLRVPNLSQSVSPPAAIIGPPRLTWEGWGSVAGPPTTCQWNVYLVMAINQYAINNLLALVASVTGAIESQTAGVVLSAGPGTYNSSAGPLPAYIIVVASEPATF